MHWGGSGNNVNNYYTGLCVCGRVPDMGWAYDQFYSTDIASHHLLCHHCHCAVLEPTRNWPASQNKPNLRGTLTDKELLVEVEARPTNVTQACGRLTMSTAIENSFRTLP